MAQVCIGKYTILLWLANNQNPGIHPDWTLMSKVPEVNVGNKY